MTVMLVFIIVLVIAFINGSRKTNVKDLFIDERSGRISHTKYWSNVAYLISTVVFLYMHMFNIDKIQDQLEMLWLIYLGVVAGNASVNKLISYKYGGGQSQPQTDDPYRQYSTMYQPPYQQNGNRGHMPRARDRRSMIDNPDEVESDSYDTTTR